MRKILIVVLLGILAGCGVSIPAGTISEAERICSTHGGVNNIWVFLQPQQVTCQDNHLQKLGT